MVSLVLHNCDKARFTMSGIGGIVSGISHNDRARFNNVRALVA